jgi:hypothetical protein
MNLFIIKYVHLEQRFCIAFSDAMGSQQATAHCPRIRQETCRSRCVSTNSYRSNQGKNVTDLSISLWIELRWLATLKWPLPWIPIGSFPITLILNLFKLFSGIIRFAPFYVFFFFMTCLNECIIWRLCLSSCFISKNTERISIRFYG